MAENVSDSALNLKVHLYVRAPIATLVCLAASVLASACNFCGAKEQHAINVGVYDSITVTRAGQTSRLQLSSRVGETEINRATFDSVFTAVEKGLTPDRSVILSVGGTDPATGEIILLSFILPSDLRKGAQYTVTSTFNIEPGFTTAPLAFGTRGANGSNAVLGFTTSTYTFPPANFTINYRATSASGTITVTNRSSGSVELQFAVQFTDATGRPGSLAGRMQATTERYTPPCFS